MSRVNCANPEAVVRRCFFLAWKASEAVGLGALHGLLGGGDKTEAQVWQNVTGQEDYPAGYNTNRPGEAFGDYVFGRMVKLAVRWGDDWVETPDMTPRKDYQSWAGDYPTYPSLVAAAVRSLEPEARAAATA